MHFYKLCIFLILTIVNGNHCLRIDKIEFLRIEPVKKNIFDRNLYDDILDPEICDKQLQFLTTSDNLVILNFYDAGIRLPRGILTGNLQDWGNYHQCLAIAHPIEDSVIEGKYCAIEIPLKQNPITIPELPTWPDIMPKTVQHIDKKTESLLIDYHNLKREIGILDGTSRVAEGSPLAAFSMSLAICIPKVCSTKQYFDTIMVNQSLISIDYTDNFCRIPNDKSFSVADYIAIILFSLIGLLMILSSCYDLHHTFVLKKDPKQANKFGTSFSVYTNTRRLLTFNSSPDSIHCMDGIRAIAMLWVVVGHVFSINAYIMNPSDLLEWATKFGNVWITSAPITVDTFFMMSGLLIVYTTIAKLTRSKFLKSIHLFYILRFLRLFPLLAATILLQASLFNHMSDGPKWNEIVGTQVENCRQNWWVSLLYVQNYVNSGTMCVPTTWYLAVDMQLLWLSPLVLVWLFGSRRVAWLALGAGICISLLSGSIYTIVNSLPSSVVNIWRDPEETLKYFRYYYMNTLTRASPFFVGMAFGYLLHMWRGQKVKIARELVFLFWGLSLVVSSFVIFITYPVMQQNYDNQILDNILNSYMRPLWALALGWLIFACVHGYGGPVNWFLSLNLWKLPARLSYAMYLIHYPLLFIVQGSLLSPLYFSVAGTLYRFMSDIMLTFLVSFLMTLVADSPFSTLQKLLIGDGSKSRPRQPTKLAAPPATIENVSQFNNHVDKLNV